jgi:hypothetical protein
MKANKPKILLLCRNLKPMRNRLLILATALLLLGCKKYPNGGFRKMAKNNIYGTWKLTEYYLNGFEYSDTVIVVNLQETFNEGGTFSRNYVDAAGSYHACDGGYDIAAERTILKIFPDSTYQITPTATVMSTNFYINRLTKKDLWYSFQTGSSLHQLRFTKIK